MFQLHPAPVAHMAEVINDPGGNPHVILRTPERVTVKKVRLKNANADARFPIVIKAAASSERESHTLEVTASCLWDIDPVLRFSNQALNVKLRFVATKRVLRADHEVVRAHLGAIVAAQIKRHSEISLDVTGCATIPAVQIVVIRVADGFGIKAQVGKAAKHVESRSLLRLGDGRNEQYQECNKRKSWPCLAGRSINHS